LFLLVVCGRYVVFLLFFLGESSLRNLLRLIRFLVLLIVLCFYYVIIFLFGLFCINELIKPTQVLCLFYMWYIHVYFNKVFLYLKTGYIPSWILSITYFLNLLAWRKMA